MNSNGLSDDAMIDKIWDTITDSAKHRFDYAALEEEFPIDPENFLFGIIMGLAIGEAKNIIALKLANQMMMIGFVIEQKEILAMIEEKKKTCSLEVLTTRMVNDILERGSDPFAVYVEINRFLN